MNKDELHRAELVCEWVPEEEDLVACPNCVPAEWTEEQLEHSAGGQGCSLCEGEGRVPKSKAASALLDGVETTLKGRISHTLQHALRAELGVGGAMGMPSKYDTKMRIRIEAVVQSELAKLEEAGVIARHTLRYMNITQHVAGLLLEPGQLRPQTVDIDVLAPPEDWDEE